MAFAFLVVPVVLAVAGGYSLANRPSKAAVTEPAPTLSVAGAPVLPTSPAPAFSGGPAPLSPTEKPITVYQNGVMLDGSRQPDYSKDVKVVQRLSSAQRLVNYPGGYALDVPVGMQFDFALSPSFVRIWGPHLDIKVSREWSPYEDMDTYFADYLNRFMAGDAYKAYRDINHISTLEDRWAEYNGHRTRIVSVSRTPDVNSPDAQNQYLYAYMITGPTTFFSLLFRSDDIGAQRADIELMLQSFTTMPVKGGPAYHVDYKPVLPKWNPETAAYYQQLRQSKTVTWGIFSPWALIGDYSKVAAIEQKLDFQFPVLLHYQAVDDEFPTRGMEHAWERHQVVELTMQVASGNNDNKPRTNATFALLDGAYDAQLRAFAHAATAFGHPFLFRFNNEMNTDWSQYSGIMLMSDPDLFIKAWRHVYDLFQAEGVNNAIWVFNPNDLSFPPVMWNDQSAYYPGDEYVQMLGITGYNTGSYNRAVTGERWRSFREIYDPLVKEYRPLYGQMPWMITEFASSSVGGDKAQWIRDMFAVLPEYPEIKVAVWYSYADPDQANKQVSARRYWLDETPETLQAFKDGLFASQPKKPR